MAARKRRRKKKKRYQTGLHVSPKSNTQNKYRSGWELRYMLYLDSDDDVVEWGYEQVTIQYVSNKGSGRLRKYLPDFYVVRTDRKQLVEVKPSRKVMQATVQKKTAAARTWCEREGVEFLIVTEIEMKQMGLFS